MYVTKPGVEQHFRRLCRTEICIYSMLAQGSVRTRIHTSTYTHRHTKLDIQNRHTKSTYKNRHTQIDIHKSTYTHRHTQIDIHKSTYTNRHTHIDIHKSSYTHRHTQIIIHTFVCPSTHSCTSPWIGSCFDPIVHLNRISHSVVSSSGPIFVKSVI